MRSFARICPQFWTGETGRAIRKAGARTQLVALYLLSAPGSSMTGIYYLPISTVCHEVGISRATLCKAFATLENLGFAFYDPAAELVFIPEMARFQIGDTLQPRDKRVTMICRIVAGVKSHPFAARFWEKYREAFHLPERPGTYASSHAPSKDLPRTFEAPSKPGAVSGEGTGAGSGEPERSVPFGLNGPVVRHSFREKPPKSPTAIQLLTGRYCEISGESPAKQYGFIGRLVKEHGGDLVRWALDHRRSEIATAEKPGWRLGKILADEHKARSSPAQRPVTTIDEHTRNVRALAEKESLN